jgi:membrane protein implicated in regulation of membrane protease activity
MSTLALFYLFCLLVGLVYSVISVILGGHHIEFGGHEMGGHAGGHGTNGEMTFSPWSPVVIASFITAFGAGGLISYNVFDITGIPSILIGLLFGLVTGVIVFYIFYSIFKVTQSSSEAIVGDLVGSMAEVITPISQNGLGEIAYIIKGSRYTAPAKSANGSLIETK